MSDRQTGRTTEQMRNAPHGATFVWSFRPGYARDLARRLGRGDLRIVMPDALTDGRCLGIDPEKLILDHDARLNAEESAAYRFLTIGRAAA